MKTHIKINGLTQKISEKSIQIIQNIKIKNKRIEYLENQMKKYFETTLNEKVNYDKISCSSDIIESSFGKYKNYIGDNPMTGITNLALCLSSFTANFENHEIKNAMEEVKISDLKNWSKENIGETNMSKRKKIFKNGVNK